MRWNAPLGLQPNGGFLYRCPDCCCIWPSDRGNIETFRCCDNEPLDLLGTLADYLGCKDVAPAIARDPRWW